MRPRAIMFLPVKNIQCFFLISDYYLSEEPRRNAPARSAAHCIHDATHPITNIWSVHYVPCYHVYQDIIPADAQPVRHEMPPAYVVRTDQTLACLTGSENANTSVLMDFIRQMEPPPAYFAPNYNAQQDFMPPIALVHWTPNALRVMHL